MSNVEAITRRLKGREIVNHMYSILFRQYVKLSGQVADQQKESDTFHLICSVHKEASSKYSYDAISSSVMNIVKECLSSGLEKSEQDRTIKRVRDVTRSLATHAGHYFDAKMLLDSFLLLGVADDKWSRREEEYRARLILHLVILSVSKFYQKDVKDFPTDAIEVVRKNLMEARRAILVWCCTKYGPHFNTERKRKTATPTKIDSISGLKQPDYHNVFTSDPIENPKWMETMLCILFLEDAESTKMKKLMFPRETSPEDDAEWEDDLPILRLCCTYSDRVGADLVKIVLDSTSLSCGIDSEMAIQILEHLFHSCSQGRRGTLCIDDPDIVWELYSLVQYTPPRPTGKEADKELKEKIDQLPR